MELTELPVEILTIILGHITDAGGYLSFRSSCQLLHDVPDGYIARDDDIIYAFPDDYDSRLQQRIRDYRRSIGKLCDIHYKLKDDKIMWVCGRDRQPCIFSPNLLGVTEEIKSGNYCEDHQKGAYVMNIYRRDNKYNICTSDDVTESILDSEGSYFNWLPLTWLQVCRFMISMSSYGYRNSFVYPRGKDVSVDRFFCIELFRYITDIALPIINKTPITFDSVVISPSSKEVNNMSKLVVTAIRKMPQAIGSWDLHQCVDINFDEMLCHLKSII
jgi:hypothetical protein